MLFALNVCDMYFTSLFGDAINLVDILHTLEFLTNHKLGGKGILQTANILVDRALFQKVLLLMASPRTMFYSNRMYHIFGKVKKIFLEEKASCN